MNTKDLKIPPFISKEEEKELSTRTINKVQYYYHPTLGYYDHNTSKWCKYPISVITDGITYSYITSPHIIDITNKFIQSLHLNDKDILKIDEELAIIRHVIINYAKKHEHTVGVKGTKWNKYLERIGLSHGMTSIISKNYGSAYIKVLVDNGILNKEKGYYSKGLYNYYYNFNNFSTISIEFRKILFKCNNKALNRFISALYTSNLKPKKIELTSNIKDMAKHSLNIINDPSKFDEYYNRELDRLKNKPENKDTPIEQLENIATINLNYIIINATHWNSLTYYQRLESHISQDDYGKRIYSSLNQLSSWTRDYIINDDRKVSLADIDMKCSQLQIMIKLFNITKGKLYNAVKCQDYYEVYVNLYNELHPDKPINRSQAKLISLEQLFSKINAPLVKQLIKIYPELKELMTKYKSTKFKYKGKEGKDYLNKCLVSEEVNSMNKAVDLFNQLEIDCCTSHDGIKLFIDPKKLENFKNKELLHKYFIKTITNIMTKAFEMDEIQLHVKFNDEEEKDVAVWNINNSSIIVVHKNYVPIRIYSNDRAEEEKWFNEMIYIRKYISRYGFIDKKGLINIYKSMKNNIQ